MSQTEAIEVRPLRRTDRPAVRDICIEAGWGGRPAWEFLRDTALWADLWTEYYLVREPNHCFVAAAGGRAVGYLIGCADTFAAERFFAARVLPKVALRAVLTAQWRHAEDRRFFVRMIRATRRGEVIIPHDVLRDYPAHFHFNVRAGWRGQGLGGRLFERFEQCMRRAGVRGLHNQVLASNRVAHEFHLRRGYRQIARQAVPSLSGFLEPGEVALVTLVKRLDERADKA